VVVVEAATTISSTTRATIADLLISFVEQNSYLYFNTRCPLTEPNDITKYISITPRRLVKLLENVDIEDFNELRKEINQQIAFDRLDLC
jgi:hypothetical protein